MSHFYTGTIDPSDLESSYMDFNRSPALDKGKGRLQQPQAPSAITSPTNSFLPLDMGDDSQLPLQPSHNYGEYKQQTGLPTQILAPQMMVPGYNTSINESQLYESMNMSQNFDMNSPQDFNFDSFLDENALDFKQEEVQQPIRFYPGMNQQQAQVEKMMRQRQLALEAEQEKHLQASRRSTSHQPLDQRTEDTISRVMNEIRRSSHADAMSPNGSVMPSIIRAKKDEEEMDEDERLLNSEEGKKLSSKERRQLRNKVSARAFRSRRKEYIGQLENELATKANEVTELKHVNHALMQENARFKVLAEKLLAHSAFHPFLEELSRDPALAETFSNVANPQSRQMSKDVDPYSGSQQFVPSNSETHVGLTLIPEMPVDLSSLNLGSGNNWGVPSSRAMSQFLQPQVFAVTEIEQQQESVDFTSLSGKTEDVLSQFSEEEKTTYPELDTPVKSESVIEERATTVEITQPENQIDENDESMTLFAPSKPTTSSSTPENVDNLFGTISFGKATAHFELSVSTEQDNQALSEQFDRMCLRLDARFNRIEAMMSGL